MTDELPPPVAPQTKSCPACAEQIQAAAVVCRHCGFDYRTGLMGKQSESWNGLAIASLVLGIMWLYWIGSILAIVFGFIAMKQINDSGGMQKGRGLAIAGIVLGFVWIALTIVVILFIVGFGREVGTTFSETGGCIGDNC